MICRRVITKTVVLYVSSSTVRAATVTDLGSCSIRAFQAASRSRLRTISSSKALRTATCATSRSLASGTDLPLSFGQRIVSVSLVSRFDRITSSSGTINIRTWAANIALARPSSSRNRTLTAISPQSIRSIVSRFGRSTSSSGTISIRACVASSAGARPRSRNRTWTASTAGARPSSRKGTCVA